MSTWLIPSRIAGELDIAERLERQHHEAIAVSDWSLVHPVREEVNRRIGRIEGVLNVRVPVQLDTHCSRCLTLAALRREISDRFRSGVPLDGQRHQ